MPKLLNVTESQLNKNDDLLNSLYRKIMIKNDNSKQHFDKLMTKIEQKSRVLKQERRVKGHSNKADFIIVSEKGYQREIDKVFTFLKFGPQQYELMKEQPASRNING